MSLTFPTLRFSGQRTRLSGKKKKASILAHLILFSPPVCLFFSPYVCIVGWPIGYASHVHKGLPSCTDNHRVERSHRLQTLEEKTVSKYVTIYVNTGSWSNVRSKRGGARYERYRCIDPRGRYLEMGTSLLAMIPGTRLFFFFFFFNFSLRFNR